MKIIMTLVAGYDSESELHTSYTLALIPLSEGYALTQAHCGSRNIDLEIFKMLRYIEN